MCDFIYNAEGLIQGFRLGNYLCDMTGREVGRVSAERVYRFDGSYVGEMFRNMVVEKPVGARPNLPPVSRPADAEPRQPGRRQPGLYRRIPAADGGCARRLGPKRLAQERPEEDEAADPAGGEQPEIVEPAAGVGAGEGLVLVHRQRRGMRADAADDQGREAAHRRH